MTMHPCRLLAQICLFTFVWPHPPRAGAASAPLLVPKAIGDHLVSLADRISVDGTERSMRYGIVPLPVDQVTDLAVAAWHSQGLDAHRRFTAEERWASTSFGDPRSVVTLVAWPHGTDRSLVLLSHRHLEHTSEPLVLLPAACQSLSQTSAYDAGEATEMMLVKCIGSASDLAQVFADLLPECRPRRIADTPADLHLWIFDNPRRRVRIAFTETQGPGGIVTTATILGQARR